MAWGYSSIQNVSRSAGWRMNNESLECDRVAALAYVRAAWHRGAASADRVMPGVKSGKTFQIGASLVKAGHIMVNGPNGCQFRLSDLWKKVVGETTTDCSDLL